MFMMLYFLYIKNSPKISTFARIIVGRIDKTITADTALIGTARILVLSFIHSLEKKHVWRGNLVHLLILCP